MTREIALTQGKTALVDDPDFDLVCRLKWHWTSAGAQTNMGGKPVLMHRLILAPHDDVDVVFLNGNKWDCRRENMQTIDAGYAQWIERDVYGLPSLTPVLAKLEETRLDVWRDPETWDEAIAVRNELERMGRACYSVVHEKEIFKALYAVRAADAMDWKYEVKRLGHKYRNRLAEVRAILNRMQLAGAQQGSADQTANEAKGTKMPPTRTPEEQLRVKGERFRKWYARQQATAALLADDDPIKLILQLQALLSTLEHEGRVVLSNDERAILDAASNYARAKLTEDQWQVAEVAA
jgi:hypothetical protein